MSSHKKDPEKTVDLPPHGSRNPDPITDAPGSHPIEVGVGAALGGAASGMAVGAVAGPIGAAIGAAAGAIAGGLAGKGVGEVIDPTTEDNWLRESFSEKKYVRKGDTFDTYHPAYKYAGDLHTQHSGKSWHEVESHAKSDWEATHAKTTGLAWDHAHHAVKDAYDRTIELREEKLKATKTPVQTGEARVRKEVITETKTLEVPVEREEIVIERHAVNRPGHAGTIQSEEIRIPVKEEQVHITKDSVVKEEVSVGKRKVQETKTVTGDVKREELVVEKDGTAKVSEKKTGH